MRLITYYKFLIYLYTHVRIWVIAYFLNIIKTKHYICEYMSKKFKQYILYIVKTLETNLEKNNSLQSLS